MGNCPSRSGSFTQPSEALAWRTSSRGVIPYSDTVTTYEKLCLNSNFREFLYRYLDSEYLVSSLLDNNAYDEGELTAGIHFFRCMTLAVRATIEYESESLHSVVIAGVRVQLHEFLRICENDVELRSGRNLVSPFLGSFQRRIATQPHWLH